MKVDTNVWGVVILLDHNEVASAGPQKVASAIGGSGGLLAAVLAAVGVAAATITLVVGAVTAGIAATWAAITAADIGYGTYVTIPWPAIFALAPVFIPTSRPPVTPLPAANWATSANGTFGTTDPADKISYQITHNAMPPVFILFKLVLGPQLSGWWKSIQLASGVIIQVTGQGATSTGPDAPPFYKNPNARIVFSKVKEFGRHVPVLRLPGLDQLKAGDEVVFTWETD